jgi:hypothetical protein
MPASEQATAPPTATTRTTSLFQTCPSRPFVRRCHLLPELDQSTDTKTDTREIGCHPPGLTGRGGSPPGMPVGTGRGPRRDSGKSIIDWHNQTTRLGRDMVMIWISPPSESQFFAQHSMQVSVFRGSLLVGKRKAGLEGSAQRRRVSARPVMAPHQG